MRRPGTGDGYSRGSGMAAGRAAALLAVAVVLGIILLNAADDTSPRQVAAGTEDSNGEETTTSTAVSTTVVTLPVRAPADVRVISANATDVKGVARKATDQLKAAGYNVLSPTDASKAPASAVYFVGDYMREAEAVATALGLPPTTVQPLPTPPPLADARGATVIVLVGPELAAQLSGTTATTAAAATSSTTAP